jgi:hypothetical protein
MMQAWMRWSAAALPGSLLLRRCALAAVAYETLLHISYFLLSPGVMHRDDWRHVLERLKSAGPLERILMPDAGHIMIYSLSLEEIGRAWFGTDEQLAVLIALTLSLAGFLVVLRWLLRTASLAEGPKALLIIALALMWLIPMGGYSVWSLGSAAMLTTTGAVAVLVLCGRWLAAQPAAHLPAERFGTAAPLPARAVLLLFLAGLPIALASGGGMAIFPAIALLMILLGQPPSRVGMFAGCFAVTLVAAKVGLGAPAGTMGSFGLGFFPGVLGYPGGLIVNLLGHQANALWPWIEAFTIGGLVLVLSAALAGVALRQRLAAGRSSEMLAIGLAILGYGYIIGALIAVGRSGNGLNWAPLCGVAVGDLARASHRLGRCCFQHRHGENAHPHAAAIGAVCQHISHRMGAVAYCRRDPAPRQFD